MSFGRSSSNDLPDRLPALLGVGVRLGPDDTFVDEPGVQLAVALEPQPRREEALAHEADLVLDLALLPARSRRAGDRLDEMVRAHLEEAAIVLAVLADEDRVHRRTRSAAIAPYDGGEWQWTRASNPQDALRRYHDGRMQPQGAPIHNPRSARLGAPGRSPALMTRWVLDDDAAIIRRARQEGDLRSPASRACISYAVCKLRFR